MGFTRLSPFWTVTVNRPLWGISGMAITYGKQREMWHKSRFPKIWNRGKRWLGNRTYLFVQIMLETSMVKTSEKAKNDIIRTYHHGGANAKKRPKTIKTLKPTHNDSYKSCWTITQKGRMETWSARVNKAKATHDRNVGKLRKKPPRIEVARWIRWPKASRCI